MRRFLGIVLALALFNAAGCKTVTPPEVLAAKNAAEAAKITAKSRLEVAKLEVEALKIEASTYAQDKKATKNKGEVVVMAEGRDKLAETDLSIAQKKVEIAKTEGDIAKISAESNEATQTINNRVTVASAEANLRATSAPVTVFAENEKVVENTYTGDTPAKINALSAEMDNLKRLLELLVQKETGAAPSAPSGTAPAAPAAGGTR